MQTSAFRCRSIFSLGGRFTVNQFPANTGKSLPLSLLRQHLEHPFQLFSGLRMHRCTESAFVVIFQRRGIRVCCSLIDLARCNAVHDHFRNVTVRHRHRLAHAMSAVNAVIDPIFIMMAVSSLMMHPCGRITVSFPLRIVGTSGSLIIPDPRSKLSRAVL